MNTHKKLACLAGWMVAWAGLAWAAPAPQVIPFQGRLTNQDGIQFTEGTYTILFNLYDAPVGGTALWTERHTGVGLVNGMVNVFLGSISPLDGQDFTQTRYLGITIDADGNANTADPEMVPRQMIVPAFFAKDSEKLVGADWSEILAAGSNDPRTGYINGTKLADGSVREEKLSADSVTSDKIVTQAILPSHLSPEALNDLASAFLPPGVIMPFAGPENKVPDGWLLCDGRTVNSEQYPILFENIGTHWGFETNITGNGVTYFKLPNFQNRTLWGADEHPVGEYVEAGLPNITGDFYGQNYGSGWEFHGAFYPTEIGHKVGLSGAADNNNYQTGFDASRSNPVYGNSETVQPPAGAVNFIIKVDPTY